MEKFNLVMSSVMVLLAMTSACKDEKTNPAPTKTDLITAGQYSLQAIALANGADVTLAIGVTKVLYKKDGTLTQTLANGTTRNGTWAFLNNETKISLTIPGLTPASSTWSILSITEDVFNKKSGDYASFFGGDLQYNQTKIK